MATQDEKQNEKVEAMNLPVHPAQKFHSLLATDEIETAAEIAAENFVDNDLLLTVTQLAEHIGCTPSAVCQQMRNGAIPSEKHGKKRYVRTSVADIVKELRETHGRFWAQHATWGRETVREDLINVDEEGLDRDERVLFVIKERGRELMKEKRFEAACEIFNLLFDLAEEME